MMKKEAMQEVAVEVILLLHRVGVPVLNVRVNQDVKLSRKTSWTMTTMTIFTPNKRHHHHHVLELEQLNNQIPNNLSPHPSLPFLLNHSPLKISPLFQ